MVWSAKMGYKKLLQQKNSKYYKYCWVDKEQLIRLIVGIMKDINTAQMVELSNKDGREEKSFRWELLGKILYGRV